MLRVFLNTITKIFDLPAWIQQIPSTGIDAGHTPRAVAVLVLMGSLLRMQSLEELERWVRAGRLRRFSAGYLSADTIRRHLPTIPPPLWHDLLHKIGRQFARNRAWPTIGGLHVVALDGVELFVQHSVTCADCLERAVTKTAVEWFHRIVVASTVGANHRFALAWETVHPRDGNQKQEGEQTGAHRLLDTLRHQYHHQIDVIVADALYASRVFIGAVRAHGWDTVIRLKDDQKFTILEDARGLKKLLEPLLIQVSTQELVTLWDMTDLDWGPCHHLRVIAWKRTVTRRKRGRRHRQARVTTKQTGWLLTTLSPEVSPYTVFTIMHHRWDLEECIFRQGKTTWHLNHCFGHNPATIEALVAAQLAAVTLWNWWTERGTVSHDKKRLPRQAWIDDARDQLMLMRTNWAARWCVQPT